MSVEELYRDVILDHYRNPRHKGKLESPSFHGEGQNPLCGDEVFIDVAMEDGAVVDVGISGQGCSISQASASMMADAIIGLDREHIAELAKRFKTMMSIEEGDAGLDPARPGAVLGDLEALQGVRKFPVRIKCADLPWATLEEALSS